MKKYVISGTKATNGETVYLNSSARWSSDKNDAYQWQRKMDANVTLYFSQLLDDRVTFASVEQVN